MSYQITDTGASIRFANPDGFFYLLKHHIKGIRMVNYNMIRIDTGCCLHSIFIDASQVETPLNTGGEDLAGTLNDWLTTFLKGYPDPTDR